MVIGLFLAVSASSVCPPVQTQAGFNQTEYLRATWYVRSQQVNAYQPLNRFYCVTATYHLGGAKVPGFSGQVVSVHNYDNADKVNGVPSNPNNSSILCARVPDSKVAKILVAPCFLPNQFAGDYWVIAAGPTAKRYEWAAISGGQPTVQTDKGCTTKEDSINFSGLWIFSRSPTAQNFEPALAALRSQGFDTSRLRPVTQRGCNYAGAWIKPDVPPRKLQPKTTARVPARLATGSVRATAAAATATPRLSAERANTGTPRASALNTAGKASSTRAPPRPGGTSTPLPARPLSATTRPLSTTPRPLPTTTRPLPARTGTSPATPTQSEQP